VLQSGIRAQVYEPESSLESVVISMKSLKLIDLGAAWRAIVEWRKRGMHAST